MYDDDVLNIDNPHLSKTTKALELTQKISFSMEQTKSTQAQLVDLIREMTVQELKDFIILATDSLTLGDLRQALEREKGK